MTSPFIKVAIAAALAATPFAASAATITPSQISATGGNAGTADGTPDSNVRTDLDNAIDGDTASFYSLGAGGSLTVDISPLTLGSPASVLEFTFNSPNDDYPESAELSFGSTVAGEIFNDGTATAQGGFSFGSSVGTSGAMFTINLDGGSYSTFTITDTTLDNFASDYTDKTTDGFDIAEVSVSAVPLPAGLPLLASVLAGLGFFGWRRRAA